jgi:2-polyprenyl-3-methyl-5-hydroxy-6-metoxy-1,4-benzoquinol methylase
MTPSTRRPADRSGPEHTGHYSYTHYADPDTARTFDDLRFGGPIGELVAAAQAEVLVNMVGALRNRSILDVGTGTGRAALLLARGGARVTAVDPAEAMLAVARQRAAAEQLTIRFETGDAHALGFPDRSYDVVVSLRMLMHTPEWRQALSEMCRVARRLVIFDYPSSRSTARLQSVWRGVVQRAGRPTEAYRVFSDAQIAAALDAAGFRLRSVHRQFVLPIALHKAIGSPAFTVKVESLLGRMGLLKLFGSPVTVVAERCVIS